MRYDVVIDSKFKKSLPKVTKQVIHFNKSVQPTSRIVKETIYLEWQNGKRIPLIGPEETLFIQPPEGVDYRDCCIRVKSRADVLVLCCDAHSRWEFRIPSSDDPGADAPATVNLTLAPDEPEEDEEDDE